MLALNDHLTSCAACREQLRQMRPRSTALLVLRASLRASDEATSDHLSHEHLLAYTNDHLDEIDHELAESHLETCPQCARQAQELRNQTARTVAPSSASASTKFWSLPAILGLPSLWKRFPPLPVALPVASATGVIALLIVAALWLRPQKNEQQVVGPHLTPLLSTSPSPNTPPPARQATPAPTLIALNDGHEQISLDAQGDITGLGPLSPIDQRRVKAALETQKVQVSKTLEELRSASGPIMGSANKADLALLSPIRKILVIDRPTFRWQPIDGAINYQVTITYPAAGYKQIAVSPQLEEIRWTIDRPLERGRVYIWQVIARTNAGEVKSPEAKFKVLERRTSNELSMVKKAYPGRHLVLGLLYAEAGLLDEAEHELKALATANPQSLIAAGLLRDLQSKQRKQ